MTDVAPVPTRPCSECGAMVVPGVGGHVFENTKGWRVAIYCARCCPRCKYQEDE